MSDIFDPTAEDPVEKPGFLEARQENLDAPKEIVLSMKSIMFNDPESAVKTYLYITNALKFAKELKARWDKEFIDSQHPPIVLDDGTTVKTVKERKEKFATDAIYDLFNFTPVQRNILEKNPGFRKTALEVELGEDGLKDVVQVTFTEKVRVEEINEKFLKGRK